MAREGRFLPAPFTADGPFLAEILSVLDGIHELLQDRLPAPTGAGPVPAAEPAQPTGPVKAVPVKEPAPAIPPEPEDDEEPVNVEEPAPARQLPDPPPRVGRGSSRAAWAGFADTAAVTYPETASRDDIIAACATAGVIEAE